MNYNIRSFSANSDTFFNIFGDNNLPQIFVLSETWFNVNNTQELPGYKSHHVFRSDCRSGGISIYVRDDIISFKLDDFSFVDSTIEICTVCFYKDNIKHYLFGIYRPHSGTIDSFRWDNQQFEI